MEPNALFAQETKERMKWNMIKFPPQLKEKRKRKNKINLQSLRPSQAKRQRRKWLA